MSHLLGSPSTLPLPHSCAPAAIPRTCCTRPQTAFGECSPARPPAGCTTEQSLQPILHLVLVPSSTSCGGRHHCWWMRTPVMAVCSCTVLRRRGSVSCYLDQAPGLQPHGDDLMALFHVGMPPGDQQLTYSPYSHRRSCLPHSELQSVMNWWHTKR